MSSLERMPVSVMQLTMILDDLAMLLLILLTVMRSRRWSRWVLFDLGAVALFAGIAVSLQVCHNHPDTAHLFLPWWVHLLLPAAAFVYFAFAYRNELRYANTHITDSSVREAMDNMESGLCYATREGRIVLANHAMLRLAQEMTGEYLRNAEAFWSRMMQQNPNGSVEPISFTSDPAYRFPDGRVYSFTRGTITDGKKTYTEIIAHDVTSLWEQTQKLARETERLRTVQTELSETLRNIAQIGQEEELLASKMRLHDRLGSMLLQTRLTLAQDCLSEEDRISLVERWRSLLDGLERNLLAEETDTCGSPLQTLKELAKTLGFCISFSGDAPADTELFAYALREAMYNAIRHASADTLFVDVADSGERQRVYLRDNGGARVSAVQEGGGLRTLREKIERLGGCMTVELRDGVCLDLILPKGDEK